MLGAALLVLFVAAVIGVCVLGAILFLVRLVGLAFNRDLDFIGDAASTTDVVLGRGLVGAGAGVLGYLLSALFWFIDNYNLKHGGSQDEGEIFIILLFIGVPFGVELAALALGLHTRHTVLGRVAICLSLLFLCPVAWLLFGAFRG